MGGCMYHWTKMLARRPVLDISRRLAARHRSIITTDKLSRCCSAMIRPSYEYRAVVMVTSVEPCRLCMKTKRGFHTNLSFSAPKKKRRDPIKYPPKAMKKKPEVTLTVWKNMTVAQLAEALSKDIDHVFEAMLFVDNSSDYDSPHSAIDNVQVLVDVVKRSGLRCVVGSNPFEHEEAIIKDVVRRPPPDPQSLVKRPPVVTVMGHVDHGKTTLLDSLRHTSVVSEEFGGITQHIGAFAVSLSSGQSVTFLDTPGHAAFSAMRARGAHVTDIIVLVVAADDGVMQQTIESIQHAAQAKVPVIVAINKMDKPTVNIEHCKRELLQNGIQLEDFGGDVQAGTNLEALVEAILTQAELMELKADPKGLVEGVVIESRTDLTRGKLSTAIIQRGTLRKGAFLVSGTSWAKVRGMFDDSGQLLDAAPPSTPVEVIGWRSLPSAGDELLEVESERRAKEVVEYRIKREEKKKQDQDYVVIKQKADEHLRVYKADLEQRRLEGLFRSKRKGPRPKESIVTDTTPRLSIILKGDVDGSVEAILDVLDTYHSSNKCRLDIIHYGVGPVTENDVSTAQAFEGIIYSFNVAVLNEAKELAKTNKMTIKNFNIIYRLVDDLKEEINARLPTKEQDTILGEANVIQEFLINEGRRKVAVAGCHCIKGTLKKDRLYRIKRGEEIIHEGSLTSMRHLKDEVTTIKKGMDCGLRLCDDEVRFQAGDIIICYEKTKVPQTTDWDPGF